jgi:hypothetical protein
VDREKQSQFKANLETEDRGQNSEDGTQMIAKSGLTKDYDNEQRTISPETRSTKP